MTKSIFIALCIILLHACSENAGTTARQKNFQSFEITYTNGWERKISCLVDSNKIYFSPTTWDSANYGLLPDSIFSMVDVAAGRLRTDTSIKWWSNPCFDCPALAIRLIAGKDTMDFENYGPVDSLFYPLVTALEKFHSEAVHQKLRAAIWLDTYRVIAPPPPLVR
jgi:hypothetical protein